MQSTRTLALAFVASALVSSCGVDHSSSQISTTHVLPAAAGPNFAINPATGRPFVIDANQGGQAPSLTIASVRWGKLVDVYDLDTSTGRRTLRFADMLVGDDIVGDGVTFELVHRPVTHRDELTVLHAYGTASFDSAFALLEVGLHAFLPKSLAPTELPPFTMQPRNAALAIQLDDLLDDGGNPGDPNYPGTVDASNVRVVAGLPPLAPFEARVLPDPNHGALIAGQFHSTRVLVDMSVTVLEALHANLAVNPLGLPEATTVAAANAGVRVPTQVDAAAQQFQVLRNLGGAAVSFANNGPTDPSSPTLDVVRAFRSGGRTNVTGDPYNGFVRDEIAPQLLVVQTAFVTSVQQPAGFAPNEFRVLVRFPIDDSAVRAHVGDVITTANHIAQVVRKNSHTIDLELVEGDPATFATGVCEFTTPWSPMLHIDPVCALRFSPRVPGAPGLLVDPAASVRIALSEPIDPSTVRPFDTFRIAPLTSPQPFGRWIVGSIAPAVSLSEFTFVPSVPLAHAANASDGYFVDVVAQNGITDLAGNELALGLLQAPFTLDPAASAVDSSGVVLRFTSTDEDLDGKPDLRGQVLYDLAHGLLSGRQVAHFAAQVDESEPIVAVMGPLAGPIQTPLIPQGAKMMSLWRYVDLGFGLRDEATHNLDVEGLAWEPFAQLNADTFAQFQMSLAHAKFLPDELQSTGLLPTFPTSGLAAQFASNLLDPVGDPLTIVHAKALGYAINPSDYYVSSSGHGRAPWPLNRNVSVSQYTYWTWRDTAKLAIGAPLGQGADPGRLWQVTQAANVGFYPPNRVPTIGLPLLQEFRAYPSTQAIGSNGLRIAIAINTSATPYFRAFSSGGTTLGGQTVLVDPDTANVATGGIHPFTGAPTAPRDNAVYFGEADFVVRVSRAHTIWFDTMASSQFAAPLIDPASFQLPAGTQISVAVRGASAISPAGGTSWRDARNLDPYGDSYSGPQHVVLGHPAAFAFTPTFYNVPSNVTDPRWHSNVSEISGARYVQMRVSFVANAETAARPKLDSLAIAFTH